MARLGVPLLELGRRFIQDEKGATAIEYGLICALIFLAVVTAVTTMSDKLIHNFWEPTAKAMPA